MNKVFGICMVRNADDIIGYIVEHMIAEVDHVIVADNLSDDNTRSILEKFGNSISLLEDNDPAYRQSEKMTHLANVAKKHGAEWVVPFDADEWWYSPSGGTIKDAILSVGLDVYQASMYDHRPTGVDSEDPNPMKRIAWRNASPAPMQKVACRVKEGLVIEMGNHSVTYPNPSETSSAHGLLEIRHYPYRTAEQFVDKAVVGAMALDLTDLPYWQGQHWRDYHKIVENHGEEALKDVFRQYFWSSDPATDGFVFDPIVP